MLPVQVSCGAQHTACILNDGSAYTWGCAAHGCLGLEELQQHQQQQQQQGGAAAQGSGDSTEQQQLTVSSPQRVHRLKKMFVTAVSCGAFHTAFLVNNKGDTSLYTCGLGLSGRLGECMRVCMHFLLQVLLLLLLLLLCCCCRSCS